MTQEEKVRRYDEALERARKIHNDTEFDYEKGMMEEIFPELKESEDEKIRRTIIRFFKDQYSNETEMYDGSVTVGKAIAWLEKQDVNTYFWKPTEEQINALEHFVRSIGESGYASPYDDNTKLLKSLINDLYKLKKDGGQIPVDKAVPKFKVGDTMRTLQEANDGYTDGMPVVVSIDNEYYHCTNELIAIKDQDDYEFPPINMKQNHNDKPKWSEEDDGMVACIKIHLKQCLNNYAYTRYRKWLESLKQRMEK